MKLNSYCLESFQECFEIFPGEIKFSRQYKYYCWVESCFSWKIFFYCLESFLITSGKFPRTSGNFSRTYGNFSSTYENFSRTYGNFSRSQEICPDNLKYESVFERCFFYERINLYCAEKFAKFLEIFQKQMEFLQSIWNINVGLKAIFHEIISSYCLESFPEYLETFREQIKPFKAILNIKDLFYYYYYYYFYSQYFWCSFWKSFPTGKNFPGSNATLLQRFFSLSLFFFAARWRKWR